MWAKVRLARAVSILSAGAFMLSLGGGLWAYFALRGAATAPGAMQGAGGTQVILHWNDLSGITSAGGLGAVVFMAIFGVAASLLNFAIALELDARDRFLGKLVAAATFAFAVLLFIAFAAIISVNG